MMSLPKQWKQWENADFGGTKQNINRWKGFDESCSKMQFLLNLSFCVKSCGHFCQIYQTTHQIWSRHVTLASNSENVHFSPNSVLKFRKSYQFWGKLAKEQKSYRQKQIGGGKHPQQCL